MIERWNALPRPAKAAWVAVGLLLALGCASPKTSTGTSLTDSTTTTAAPTSTTTEVAAIEEAPTTEAPTTAAPTTEAPTVPPTTAAAPPTTAYVPPTTRYTPPTTAYVPPTTAYTPPTQASSGVYYANCTAAKAAGAAPLYRGQPGYRPELDRDSDGIACEK